MKKLLMVLAVAVAAVVTQTVLAATVAVTGYDPGTRQVSLAFSGLERDMSLVAVADRTDKGTDDLSQWATSVFVGAVHQGDETLTWDLPRTIDALGGAVRFVLLDLGGAYPVSSIQNSGNAYVDTAATGCLPTYNDAVEIHFATVSGTCWLYDARRDDLTKRFSVLSNSGFILRVDRGDDAYYDVNTFVPSQKYRLDVDYKKRTVELDGVEWGGGNLSSGLDYDEMEHSPLLFASRYNGAISFGEGKAQIFRFRIVDTVQNSVKMELLPCVKEGVVGFVDCVSHLFLANSGASETELEAMSSLDISDAACAVASSCMLSDALRKVSVVEFDEKSGSVTLGFTTTGESNLLYVARADYDCGTDPFLWENSGFLAEVPANTTSLTCQLPADVLQGQGCLRFFLSRWLDQKPGLPIGVTEVESLYSDGNAWINTGIQPDATTAISVVSKQDTTDTCVFGIFGCFYFFNTYPPPNPVYYCGYGEKTDTISSLPSEFFPGNKRTMMLGPDGAFIDGTRVSSAGAFDGATFSETHGIALFCRVDAAGTTITKNGKCTIYSAEIEKGGKVVRDLVPCVKGGVAQMYDRVTGEFLTNKGAGAFIAGEAVAQRIANVESSTKVSVGCPTISFSVGADRVMHVKLGAAAGRGVLYAACDIEDRGADLALWANQVRLGAVAASDVARTVDYELPPDWKQNKAKQYRVFYVTDEEDITEYEVEYIKNSSNSETDGAWINTGVCPDATTAISVVSKQDSIDRCVFGIAGCFYFFNINMNDKPQRLPDYWFGYGDNGKSGNNSTLDRSFFPGNRRMMRLGSDGAFIDGTRVSQEGAFDGATFPTTHGIALFCRVDAAGTTISKSGVCSIYSAEIEKGGKVVRDLVPCVKDGVAQMYDRVTGEHLTNQGSGEFTAGPRKERPASELVIGCSPCKIVSTGLFIVVK